MFRFTIRDVLWLTVVVAMGMGWYVTYRNITRYEAYINRWQRDRLAELVRERGFQVSFDIYEVELSGHEKGWAEPK